VNYQSKRHCSRFAWLPGLFISALGLLSWCAHAEDLAKKSQNPVGDIISVPFEFHHYDGLLDGDSSSNTMMVKPVYPVSLGKYNLINRAIIPVVALDPGTGGYDFDGIEPLPNVDTERGLGNIQYQGFFSPSDPGKVIWGIGPVVELPTHQNDLGSGNVSLGAAAVVLATPDNWVLGALVQNIWSVTSKDNEPDVNKLLFQYFVNYNFDNGWYLTSTPVNTANWEKDSNNRWTVPVGGGIGKLTRFGKQPVDFKLQAFGYAEKPEGGPDWSVLFAVKFLFPK